MWSTDAHLIVTDPVALASARGIAEEYLAVVGDACDRFRVDSELSRIEDASRGVQVSPMLAHLLRAALSAAAQTDGLVDPTVGQALTEAGYDRDIELVLDSDRPARVVLTRAPGWRRIHLDGDVLTMPSGVRLDLGATAKAVAADLAAADIAASLGTGVLVNLGGDIATAGDGPDNGWQVTVQDLPGDPAGQVSLRPGWGLATSSTQRRTWRRGAELQHHILDPNTGAPAAAAWRSVSVAAPTALRANTLTTAAVVLGESAVAELAATDLPARLVDADGRVVTVGGWPPDALSEAA